MQKPAQWFQNLRMKNKMLLLTMLTLALTLLLLVPATYLLMRNYVIDSATAFSEAFMQQLQLNVSARLKALEAQLFTEYQPLARQAAATESSQLRKRVLLQSAQQELLNAVPYYRGVTVVDRQGQVYGLSRDGEPPDAVDINRVQALWGACLWLPRDARSVSLQRMMYDGNLRMVGAISVQVDAEELTQLYMPTLQDMGGEMVVLDALGKPVLYRDEAAANIAFALLDAPGKTADMLVTRRALPDYGWQMIRFVSVSELMRSFNLIFPIMLGVCAIVLAATWLLSNLMYRSFAKNLEALLHNMRMLANGQLTDYSAPVSQDEVGQLATSFLQMSERIQGLMNDVKKEQEQKTQAKYTAMESQYRALRMQLNPHFLYNALDTISSIAKINRQEQLSDLVCTLSSLLRSSINLHDKFVPLSTELAELQNFTALYTAMYAERIVIAYDVDPGSLDVPVPSFLLQPLLENAILHGIEPSDRNGEILIASRREQGCLLLSVSDNGMGMTHAEEILQQKQENGGKVGLPSIRERLAILYGPQALISIQSKPGEGTRVLIHLPVSLPDGFAAEESPCPVAPPAP